MSKNKVNFGAGMSNEEILMALDEDTNGEDEDIFCEDDPDDADWQAPNDEESDVEYVLPLSDMNTAVEIQEDSGDDLEDESIEENNMVECPGHFNSRAGIKWQKSPLPLSQTRRHNILRQAGKNVILYIV